MYQSFINYKEEYDFYAGIITKYTCTSLLEIGCGSGNLAAQFAAGGFGYTGMDLSEQMLAIAKQNNPGQVFINGDMRNFDLQNKVDAAIITGRTISYLITNKDVTDTFTAIHKNLNKDGIVCFDCIDANKFIPLVDPAKKIIHKAAFKNKKYQRESIWKLNLADGFTADWASIYSEENQNGSLTTIGDDNEIVRTFTKAEMVIFLQLAGFTIKEITDRPSYAFDTFVITAQKIK